MYSAGREQSETDGLANHANGASRREQRVVRSASEPDAEKGGRLELTWVQNGDFSIHYHEDHDTSTFDHRWDRHPSEHNTREHIHPGPDAPTPGEDTEHPTDWRDVLSMVLDETENRRRGFW
jgi:hypothetical protein